MKRTSSECAPAADDAERGGSIMRCAFCTAVYVALYTVVVALVTHFSKGGIALVCGLSAITFVGWAWLRRQRRAAFIEYAQSVTDDPIHPDTPRGCEP